MHDNSRAPFQHPSYRVLELTVFVAAFFVAWTIAVLAVWKLGWLPEQCRPWFRTAIWCGAAVVWVRWQQPRDPLRQLGLWPISQISIIASLTGFAVLFGWNVLRVQVFGPQLGRLAELSLGGYAWSLIGVFVEELIFRGVIQPQLAQKYAAPIAIATTALLFLAIHVPGWVLLAIPVGPSVVASVLILGGIAGAIRLWTGSLWPAVAVHWANNLGAIL
jgi:membrane protease YdiL (CAAX protease family)